MTTRGEAGPHSFTRPNQTVAKHFHWSAVVDFNSEVIEGHVDFNVVRVIPNAQVFILDTSHDLVIHGATCVDTGKRLDIEQHHSHEKFGNSIRIRLPYGMRTLTVRVKYKTTPDSTALLWITKEQTVGKRHPYVFSRCQAIYGRGLLPCQDAPSIKSTFTADIEVGQGLTPLVSAMRTGQEPGSEGNIIYKFRQIVPMSSCFLALAVGNIESKKIGPRSNIWSEKEVIDKAAIDFEDVEIILTKAEELLGPYVWGAYDVLILPPCYPFAGMGHPCLTFMTSAVLTGDKSLSDALTRGVIHSWTGNLVTCKTFEHFWLNEGFALYIERKLIGRMRGEDVRSFIAQDGLKQLKECIQTMGETNVFTRLVLQLENDNPDESISVVPFEKGHTLLYHLETLLGSDTMDAFLRAYVDRFKYKSLDTDQFRSFLYNSLHDKKEILDKVDWETWIYTPGLPPVIPQYRCAFVAASEALCRRWLDATDCELKSFKKEEFDNLNSHQKRHFFTELLESQPISREKVIYLTELYEMQRLLNSEIVVRWLRVGIRARWEGIIEHINSYLESVGQMDLILPLFRDLDKWPERRRYAVKLYERHRPNMTYMVRQAIDNLNLSI